jgi:sulfide:quinone oxidoreductase
VLAYCRTGMRSTTMWALTQAGQMPLPQIIERASHAGFDLKGVVRRIVNGGKTPVEVADATHEVVIIGGGAAGIGGGIQPAGAQPGPGHRHHRPADIHYYQPGWTLVGAGVFNPATTARTMASVLPQGVHWIKSAVAAFEPERDAVILDGCRVVKYKQLVVCPGLKLDWHGIEGLADTLGRNGVTSNYRYDLAPYTWHLVQQLHRGRAIFSQPPMPIKCAGAPQKAMYLSADHWRRAGTVLGAIDIQFCSAGAVLFGVADYVPALMEYVKAYGIQLNFGQTLDCRWTGRRKQGGVQPRLARRHQGPCVTREFDMLHAVPPQKAPTSSASARWPMQPAGSTWTRARCATPTFRQRLRPGRRLHQHPQCQDSCCGAQAGPVVAHNLLAPGSAAPRARPGTTATAPARSRWSAARSCWPSLPTAASSPPASPRG